MRRKMEKFLLADQFGVDGCDLKHPFGQGPGLVEDDNSDLRQSLKVVRAFDKDPFCGRATYSSEERQRNRDHKGARTGDNKECQRPVEPRGECAAEVTCQDRWDEGQDKGGDDNHRGVDPGEPCDEVLASGLVPGGVLDKIKNPGGRGFSESLRDFRPDHAGKVHAT